MPDARQSSLVRKATRAAALGMRVYQYTNQDGVTFWSFEKLPTTSVGHTLRLDDRAGSNFDGHLFGLRELRRLLLEGDDGDNDEVGTGSHG